jgi:hypothetical protein
VRNSGIFHHPEEFWNAVCQHLHNTGVRNPGIVPSGGSLECNVPTLALHGINGDSAGNDPLIDDESTRGRGYLWELLAYLRGFRPVRSKFAENPSNGNNSRIGSSKSNILTMPTLMKI